MRLASPQRAQDTPSLVPLDRPRPPRPCAAHGSLPLTVDNATADGLRRAAATTGGAVSDALVAAYAWWLHLYAESTDVVFGRTPAPGQGLTPVITRCEVSSDESFAGLVYRLHEELSRAHAGAASVNTMLCQPSPVASPERAWSTTFDVCIDMTEQPGGGLVGEFRYSADLFEPETAREMASLWCRLLGTVAAEPTIPMADHNLVSPVELRRQLSWHRETADARPSQCVHELISAQVERAPEEIAVTAGAATLTYRQLDDRAAAIASSLIRAGAGPGTVVAVLVERTPDVVAAVLAVLRAGAAFLPLDPRHPVARNMFSINEISAEFIVTDSDVPAVGDATVVQLGDLDRQTPSPGGGPNPANVSPTDLAYVICTSGSTGRPKPVLTEHRGVTNLVRNLVREFGIDAGDTVLSVASISFDMALFDIFSALVCGARLVLTTAEEAVNPASMNRLIATRGSTYMFTTPTIWGALIAAGWAGDPRMRAAAGGESLTDGLAEALLQRCGAVWNGYGPTEATAGTSMARLATGDVVTVGRPLPNVAVYITDSRGRLQPVGVPGEITIGGVGVGRGYYDRPAEQAARFGDDPFRVGGRIYRTGDRGRYLPDGRVQHLGRYDEQLKLRGCRIEPGEIESTLCEHPAVGACAVVARELPGGDTQLVAYLVGENEHLSVGVIRDWLQQRLPAYMIPSAFVQMRKLPMTTNGKLDKSSLPAPFPAHIDGIDARPPTTATEARVAALWADLLGRPVTDVSSDFFDLGGHSLLAARLIAEIESTFGVTLSLQSFIDSGRIVAKLAAMLSAETSGRANEVAPDPPLHFIFSDLASAMSARHFTEAWGMSQPVHALIPEQPGGQFDRSVTIEEHARQLLSVIRERQPVGPLTLAGYSVGGLVAYEVARQAVDAGQQIQWLGVVDSIAPPLKRAHLTLRSRLRAIRHQPARIRRARYATAARRILTSRLPWHRAGFDYRGVTDIGSRYRRPGHRVPLDLFVSEVSAASSGDDVLGWHDFHRGSVTAHRLPGDHTSLLQQPIASRLAARMLESLRAAEESTVGARRD